MSAPAFTYLLRVRYAECDAQNVVFNARYADYVDIAATEFLRAIDLDYRDLLERGLDNQVVKMTLSWQAPAHFDDVLAARVHCHHLGRSSYALTVSFARHDDGTPLAEAETVYVMVTREPWEKTAIPDDIRARLQAGAPGVTTNHAGV